MFPEDYKRTIRTRLRWNAERDQHPRLRLVALAQGEGDDLGFGKNHGSMSKPLAIFLCKRFSSHW